MLPLGTPPSCWQQYFVCECEQVYKWLPNYDICQVCGLKDKFSPTVGRQVKMSTWYKPWTWLETKWEWK